MIRPRLIHLLLVGSLCVNAGVLFLWAVKGVGLREGDDASLSEFVDSEVVSPSQSKSSPPATVSDARSTTEEKSRRFQWAEDIDAPDFPTFIENLRSIGCPEATIHDILAGELSEIYAARRSELQKRSSIDPRVSKDGLDQQFSALAAEEAGLLKTLLGPKSKNPTPSSLLATVEGSSGIATPLDQSETSEFSSSVDATAIASTASLVPVAFSVGNDPAESAVTRELSTVPTDPNLDSQSSAVLRDIREKFSQGLTEAGLDPSTSLYRQRWLSEQRRADERFSSLYGGDLFVRLQIEAAQKAYQASQQSASSQNP
ncbi:MAG: hypothetical protein R3F13_06500 [Prosthecobacter sp.]